jgi:hypothetical protein
VSWISTRVKKYLTGEKTKKKNSFETALSESTQEGENEGNKIIYVNPPSRMENFPINA